jgi:hypothetical protein
VIKSIATVAVAGLLVSANAMAEISVGVKAGTLGVGVEATKSFSPTMNVRVGANVFDSDMDQTLDDIRYDASIDYKSALVAFDWHPFAGIFRLSAGAVYNKNELSLTATPASDQTIGGNTYTPADIGSLRGDIAYDKVMPYVGLGWSKSPHGGFGLGGIVEIGAIFGKPDVTFTSTGGGVSTSDLDREAENVRDDLKVYPVISVGLSFGF